MYVKAGYTKRSGGYGIISFFDGNRPLMILQIIDLEPKHAVERWMNYLSLILPSDEQKSADGDNISVFNLHSPDKLKEIWNSWFKSQIQEIDLSNDVPFYSQFDDIFSCETCWPHLKADSVSYTLNKCCNKACLKILESVGQTTNRNNQIIGVDYSDINNIIPNNNAEKVIQIIDTSLFVHKLPIMIGIHHPKNVYGKILETFSNNIPPITNHYVVIVGKIYDKIKKTILLQFF